MSAFIPHLTAAGNPQKHGIACVFRPSAAFLWIAFAVLTLAAPAGSAMTVSVGGGGVLIPAGATWKFFRGRTAPSDPADAWIDPSFDDGSWESGPSGFGYGDNDDATVLSDMRGNYVTVYIRKEFELAVVPENAIVELLIDYDDGFAAYLNGREVARRHLPSGPLTYSTRADPHEAGSPERISLGRAGDLLAAGRNVLAIEGHNTSSTSGDFSLLPVLSFASNIIKVGEAWVTDAQQTQIQGTVEKPGAASVRINAQSASFDPAEGTFSALVDLGPGKNVFRIQSLNASGEVLEEETLTVVMVPPERRYSGTLTADTTWRDAVIVENPLTVPRNITLTVLPGTAVLCGEGVTTRVEGRILAEGTEQEPIAFTHLREGATWERILLWGAQEARFLNCSFQYANSEGAHQDYYLPGPRNYHETVVAIACAVTFEGCVFQNLPDRSSRAEGDAIAVISDDPELPGEASAVIRNCRFLGIGQGIHTRFSYILVEGCFFTGKRGDNDDVDLWGESDPPPLIRNNVFLNPHHDDMINPTKCSAVIIGNIIAGSDDHGIVLRDKGTPVVMNNIIYDCSSAGIAVENTCNALIVNNTIFDCGRGIRLLDLGRSGPPYYLTPGGGTATIVNCIIWNCPTPVSLTDSPNQNAQDRGSHATIHHSIIQGGRNGVKISGSYSTLTWGEGNIDADPLFVDPGNADFHLQADSPAVDAGTSEGAPDRDLDGLPRPCGSAVDIGAYEFCTAVPGAFRRAEANADGRLDISDAIFILRYLFGAGSAPSCLKAADVNDDGSVGIADPIALLSYLFAGGSPPSAPFPGCGPDPTPDDLTCEEYPPCGL